MRISLAQWQLQDWQGPTTGVKLRIIANNSFLAREDDNSGVQVDSAPNIFREVDCVVSDVVIEGLTVKVITVPALWLYSTNDALVPHRQSTYSAIFVTKSGREIHRPASLQSFQLIKELESVFNPVPIHEVIRANNPAAPMPMDKDTFSKEQILDFIGEGSILKGGNAASPRVTFWSGPITVDGATGFEYQNADQMVRLIQQNASWNVLRLVENDGAANLKIGGNPALFSTHTVNETGLSQRAIINDAATRRWTEVVKDGALGLQYSAYDSSDVLQSNTIFDPSGGVGFSDGSNPDFGYFYKASSAYHLGINAAGAGAPAATKEITFTTSGVGINKATAIGSQLHVVSGDAGRIGLLVDTAGSPTQPVMQLRNGSSVRFSFNHDGVATFGLASSVKGRLSFAAATNTNIHSLEAPDTPAANVQYKLPATSPANGQLLRTLSFAGGVATLEWVNPTAGGDVSSDIGTTVDNRLTRFQGTTGKIITDSAIVVADTTGSFTVPNDWTVTSAGGASKILGATTQSFTVPTGNGVGPLFGFTAAAQTQSSGVVEVGKFSTTYNQTSTAGSIDISIARTQTAIGSGEHNFIKGFVGGVAQFRINNLGNYFFGATGGFIGDENGNEYLKFATVASAVNELSVTNAAIGVGPTLSATGNDTNIPLNLSPKGTGVVLSTGNIVIQNASPSLLFSDSGEADFALLTNTNTLNIGLSGSESGGVQINSTNIFTFGQIPVGPNTTPTTDNQLVRKKYVDDRIVTFSIPFKVEDPSTYPASDESACPVIVRVPSIVGGFLNKITIIRPSSGGGSHTGGTTVTFFARIFAGTTIGSGVSFSDTNNAALTVYTEDFSDVAISEGNYIDFIITKSGTIAERNVFINIEGYRKLQN